MTSPIETAGPDEPIVRVDLTAILAPEVSREILTAAAHEAGLDVRTAASMALGMCAGLTDAAGLLRLFRALAARGVDVDALPKLQTGRTT